MHPSQDSLKGCALAAFEFEHPDPSALEKTLRQLGIDAVVSLRGQGPARRATNAALGLVMKRTLTTAARPRLTSSRDGTIHVFWGRCREGVFMLLYVDLAYEQAKKEGRLGGLADLRQAIMRGAAGADLPHRRGLLRTHTAYT